MACRNLRYSSVGRWLAFFNVGPVVKAVLRPRFLSQWKIKPTRGRKMLYTLTLRCTKGRETERRYAVSTAAVPGYSLPGEVLLQAGDATVVISTLVLGSLISLLSVQSQARFKADNDSAISSPSPTNLSATAGCGSQSYGLPSSTPASGLTVAAGQHIDSSNTSWGNDVSIPCTTSTSGVNSIADNSDGGDARNSSYNGPASSGDANCKDASSDNGSSCDASSDNGSSGDASSDNGSSCDASSDNGSSCDASSGGARTSDNKSRDCSNADNRCLTINSASNGGNYICAVTRGDHSYHTAISNPRHASSGASCIDSSSNSNTGDDNSGDENSHTASCNANNFPDTRSSGANNTYHENNNADGSNPGASCNANSSSGRPSNVLRNEPRNVISSTGSKTCRGPTDRMQKASTSASCQTFSTSDGSGNHINGAHDTGDGDRVGCNSSMKGDLAAKGHVSWGGGSFDRVHLMGLCAGDRDAVDGCYRSGAGENGRGTNNNKTPDQNCRNSQKYGDGPRSNRDISGGKEGIGSGGSGCGGSGGNGGQGGGSSGGGGQGFEAGDADGGSNGYTRRVEIIIWGGCLILVAAAAVAARSLRWWCPVVQARQAVDVQHHRRQGQRCEQHEYKVQHKEGKRKERQVKPPTDPLQREITRLQDENADCALDGTLSIGTAVATNIRTPLRIGCHNRFSFSNINVISWSHGGDMSMRPVAAAIQPSVGLMPTSHPTYPDAHSWRDLQPQCRHLRLSLSQPMRQIGSSCEEPRPLNTTLLCSLACKFNELHGWQPSSESVTESWRGKSQVEDVRQPSSPGPRKTCILEGCEAATPRPDSPDRILSSHDPLLHDSRSGLWRHPWPDDEASSMAAPRPEDAVVTPTMLTATVPVPSPGSLVLEEKPVRDQASILHWTEGATGRSPLPMSMCDEIHALEAVALKLEATHRRAKAWLAAGKPTGISPPGQDGQNQS